MLPAFFACIKRGVWGSERFHMFARLHRHGRPPLWLQVLRKLQASRVPPAAAHPGALAWHAALGGVSTPAATAAESGPAGLHAAGGKAAAIGTEVPAHAGHAVCADQAASAIGVKGISPGVTPAAPPPPPQQQRNARSASR